MSPSLAVLLWMGILSFVMGAERGSHAQIAHAACAISVLLAACVEAASLETGVAMTGRRVLQLLALAALVTHACFYFSVLPTRL